VDPELTDDQRLLHDATDRFIRATLPLEEVRRLAETGGEPDASYRKRAAELGWFAFLAPEDLGGGGVSGNGLLDAAVLAELRGRHLQPGGFVDTNVVAAALGREGTEQQRAEVLPALVAGESAAAWAVADLAGDWSGPAGVRCVPAGGGYRLSGVKGLVVEPSADWLLVTAGGPDGPVQLLLAAGTPGVRVEPLTGLDLTRRLGRVHFADVEVGPSALVGSPASAVLAVAETVGAMQYLFDLSVQYSRDRTAFGRPIGSFQALKHQLADTSLLLEQSHAVATGAARAVQAGGRGAAEAAGMAKAFVGDAAVELAHKSWQLLGGISYTWEHDFHLYLRRLTTDASLHGSPTWHRERVCQLVGV
jgi:alkylation response protein AidB-like acyl-CoA dehydrogenase